MLRAVRRDDGCGWERVDDLSILSTYHDEPGELLWAQEDVVNLTDETVEIVAEEFDLHPLAVEDARTMRGRPKLEQFESHLSIVLHQLEEENGQLEARQIVSFVGEGYVLNVHEDSRRTLDKTLARWASLAPEQRSKRTYIVHTLLDVVVDDYQEIADRLELEIEELEELVLEEPSVPVERTLYSLKQRVSRLRRYALPMSRVLDWLVEGGGRELLTPETLGMFRDIDDHLLRIADQIKNVDDLSDAVLDLRRNSQAARLNETILRLTGWAAIIAVPTFIASVYGMNFELVPRSGQIFGFWFAVVVMAATSLTLYVYFKKRDWL
ncbi:MAG: magnesium transporter CorA family protein [Actinomycetota bacterium]